MRNRSTRTLLVGGITVLLVAALAGAGLAASGKKSAAGSTCLVTDVGGLNDRSFNQLAYQGLKTAQKDLGIDGRVVTSSTGADYIPNLLSCVKGGSDLTIGVGFLMADAISAVARQFPNNKFAIIDFSYADLTGKPANVRGILFREQEAGYLAGWTAIKELQSQKKKLVIGAVGGLKIPPVDRYIAGYIAGAKAANAKAKVLYGYSQSFTDQSKCKEISLNHIAQGSQVEFGVAGSCGLGSLSAAKDGGLWAVGVDADQGYLGSHMLTSAMKRVDVGVERTIKQAKDGTFHGYGNTIFSVRAGGVGLGKISVKVPASIIAGEKVLEKKLATGKVKGIPTTVS
jgi:basic membrane protein A and related proteins